MSNFLLRKYIRNAILERAEILESKNNRVRKGVGAGYPNRIVDLKLDDVGLSADQRALSGILDKENDILHPSKQQQMDHSITHRPEYKRSQINRRTLKQWWNDRVYGNKTRSDWFNNKSGENIRCVHWLAFFEEDPEIAIKKLPIYLSAEKRSHELSTLGYLAKADIIKWGESIGIEFKKRRITFAYEWDSHTEFLSSATPEIHEIHRGSGVHKRPNTYFNVEHVIFDPRDVERRHLKMINECIIDNYSLDSHDVIIHVNPELSQEQKNKIEEICESFDPPYIINY